MLEVPTFTRLPGVQSWVIGLANVRGRLLPLFDMPVFFGGKATGLRKQHRVLVVDTDSYFCGLIVDQAYGMQHFTAEGFTQVDQNVPEVMRVLVRGAYTDAVGKPWAVLNIPTLLKDAKFANAALA